MSTSAREPVGWEADAVFFLVRWQQALCSPSAYLTCLRQMVSSQCREGHGTGDICSHTVTFRGGTIIRVTKAIGTMPNETAAYHARGVACTYTN